MINRKSTFLLAVLLLLMTGAARAIDKATYYKKADGQKAAALKTALYGIVGNPNTKSYSALWTYYYQTDRMSNNQVVDRYSNETRYFSGDNGNAVSGMNKEHGIPQSWWGGGTTGIGSDLHHVMPSDTEANSRKSNYGMGVVTSQSWTNGSIKVGKGTAGNNGTVQLWEPADKWKGDFARIYFYIVTSYEERSLVQKEGANSMHANTYPKLQPWAYELYMKWSKEDPVDDLERQRNETVYSIQGNRNPFIDYEGLEQYIWGDHKDQPFSTTNYENPYGSGSSTLITPEASFALESKTLDVGNTFQQQLTTNSNGEVTYKSSAPDVASVDARTGLVTALAEGVATITATVAATNVYRSATASYTVMVNRAGVTPPPSDGTTYVKVTQRLNDWTGTYLIVCEEEDVAMDGGLTEYDQAENSIHVDIIGQNEITVTDATKAAEFYVMKMSNGKYSILGHGGKYMGAVSEKNTVDSSDSPIATTLSVTDGEAFITTESGYTLRFNAQKGQKRFRFYKSGQTAVALYRRSNADGVGDIVASPATGLAPIFDLSGRRLQRVTRPGLYIVGGKKMFLK